MSEGVKKSGKSFTPYIPQKQEQPSVENSTDPMRPNRFKVQTSYEQFLQHQSTDQPFTPHLFFFQFSSYDGGVQDKPLNYPQQIPSMINNSVDSNKYLKPQDVLLSQNKYLPYYPPMFYSPRGSIIPTFQPLNQETQDKKPPPQQHFKKEEFKLLKEENSAESEPIQIEESNSEYKPKRSTKKKPKRHTGYQCDSSESYRISRKKKSHKINDTKNITKNYSKAIISYIINNKDYVLKFLSQQKYDEFVSFLKTKKNQMTNIKQLRDLWIDGGRNQEFNKVFRIISQDFLKNQAVAYVYNSRISNTAWHLKYRINLLRALREPENFKFIKDI